MNEQKAKKIRQIGRRKAREKYEDELLFLKDILKPRPTWIPFKIWKWIGQFYYTNEYLEMVEQHHKQVIARKKALLRGIRRNKKKREKIKKGG